MLGSMQRSPSGLKPVPETDSRILVIYDRVTQESTQIWEPLQPFKFKELAGTGNGWKASTGSSTIEPKMATSELWSAELNYTV